MFAIIQKYKEEICHFIHLFLQKKSVQLNKINAFGSDIVLKIYDFVSNGKMIRGSLVLFSFDMLSEQVDRQADRIEKSEVVKAAAALELIHSGILIHDDIMDRDTFRRGLRTIHIQYMDWANNKNLDQADLFGEGAGVCAGDLAVFLGFELLGSLEIQSHILAGVFSALCQKLSVTGIAQIQDLYFGLLKKNVSEQDILSLYVYKTAHYTFSLPMMMGAILAGLENEISIKLEQLGEKLGLIFQIKDDEIEIFQPQGSIGKNIGSDIIQGKKTLFFHYLQQLPSEKIKEELNQIFNSKCITPELMQKLRELIVENGILDKINRIVLRLKKDAEVIITDLPVKQKYKDNLRQLLLYNLERKK